MKRMKRMKMEINNLLFKMVIIQMMKLVIEITKVFIFVLFRYSVETVKEELENVIPTNNSIEWLT